MLVNTASGRIVFEREWRGITPPSKPWIMVDTKAYRQMLGLILDHAIVEVGSDLYRQALGIPMGSDDSPYMSQSFFDYFDYIFIEDAVKVKNWDLALKLEYMY